MKFKKQTLFAFVMFNICTVFCAKEESKNKLQEVREKTKHLIHSHEENVNEPAWTKLKTEKEITGKDKPKAFYAEYNGAMAQFGGKYTQEAYGGYRLNFLNSCLNNDSTFTVRTTADYYIDILYGNHKKPRLLLHETVRFRYKWGSGTEVKANDGSLTISNSNFAIKGTNSNKHLLWSREAWIKIALGDLDHDYNNYWQVGLFPFQVGRGISLGSAYQVSGFLGFNPGFSIDQFAPGTMLHIEPFTNKVSFDWYVALLENLHTSFKSNNEKIRTNDIESCSKLRGTNRHSFTTAFRAVGNIVETDKHKVGLEPYIVYFKAPDQKLEFSYDNDVVLKAYGASLEGKHGKFDWGFEWAINRGRSNIKAWDRNQVKIARDSNGNIIEQYTKVYTNSGLTTLATVTSANKAVVDASNTGVEYNSYLDSDNMLQATEIGSSGLYNATDRFRPQQNRWFHGYFVVGDFSYEILPKELKVSVGGGYASGDLDSQLDANDTTNCLVKNRNFDGFVPLQSVYSGKRLRHLIIFNEGIPRFSTNSPNGTFTNQNITQPLSAERIEFTNIAFAGVKTSWDPRQWKKHKVNISPNVIGYWVPQAPFAATTDDNGNIIAANCRASNYLGLELTTEFSAKVFDDKLKVYGYFGVLFPGTYYKDMKGTKLDGQKVGNDRAVIANFGFNYAF